MSDGLRKERKRERKRSDLVHNRVDSQTVDSMETFAREVNEFHSDAARTERLEKRLSDYEQIAVDVLSKSGWPKPSAPSMNICRLPDGTWTADRPEDPLGVLHTRLYLAAREAHGADSREGFAASVLEKCERARLIMKRAAPDPLEAMEAGLLAAQSFHNLVTEWHHANWIAPERAARAGRKAGGDERAARQRGQIARKHKAWRDKAAEYSRDRSKNAIAKDIEAHFRNTEFAGSVSAIRRKI